MVRISAIFLLMVALFGAAISCTGPNPVDSPQQTAAATVNPIVSSPPPSDSRSIYEKPSSVYYEIFVRSFADGNGDGIGDLKGAAAKLDYLKELGIEGIWLMPINPSPSYHGYDVTDYYNVNPDYGTLDDFRNFLDEAHKRGIKVIMDLVVNHTSSQHPWFLESAKGKDNPFRSWYTWAEDTGASALGVSATGGKAWHEKNGSHYEGTFWEGMPDLNFDNVTVRSQMIRVGNFWLKMGVDGFRLDAAKHVYEDFQSQKANPEVARKNQAWWQEFRQGLNETNPNAYLVGEIWDSSVVVAPYLNKAFNSAFNFDLSDAINSASINGKSSNIGKRLSSYYELFKKESDGSFIDATFIGNHDKNRIMSLTQGDTNRSKMAAALLLTLPGNPFIYYGDEIGMKGSGADERKREPMLWYSAGKGPGQTNWEPAQSNNGNPVSVEAQLKDPDSMYQFYKRFIDVRKREAALRDGDIEEFELAEPNSQVMTYVRATAREKVLVVHNLSDKELTVNIKANQSNMFERVIFESHAGSKYEDGKLMIPAYSTILLK